LGGGFGGVVSGRGWEIIDGGACRAGWRDRGGRLHVKSGFVKELLYVFHFCGMLRMILIEFSVIMGNW
jgi:hypothetical protein